MIDLTFVILALNLVVVKCCWLKESLIDCAGFRVGVYVFDFKLGLVSLQRI